MKTEKYLNKGRLKNLKSVSHFLFMFGASIVILLTANFLYQTYYLGDFKIERQWIGSEYNGQVLCDSCLMIQFYEGCNRYRTYYFENQHEFDKRLQEGDSVNIFFNGQYIRHIQPTIKYRNKC